jgi:hypothetical protein
MFSKNIKLDKTRTFDYAVNRFGHTAFSVVTYYVVSYSYLNEGLNITFQEEFKWTPNQLLNREIDQSNMPRRGSTCDTHIIDNDLEAHDERNISMTE